MNANGIKASGRSSSQRSVYDYPEHLNPFYEDENHKRLRFWKIGNKSNRSNSFSIGGLKGLWSFKTFKLKKKSSTLGINKTSESPPMLRRDEDRYGSQTTFDERMRHTVDIGLGNSFQRNAPSRSSLQDLNSISRKQGDCFIRNNRYRSTMQAGNAAIGSTTPFLRTRYSQQSISHGSSQLSVNSSNPFDDEYETISQIGSPERSSIRHSARKKRRAPLPPNSPNKTEDLNVVEESKVEAEKAHNDTVNITNLTAEIESFVRTADTDKDTIVSKQTGATTPTKNEENIEVTETKDKTHENVKTSRQSPESNDFYPQDNHSEEITIEKIQNLGATNVDSNERSKRSPVKILIRAPTDEEPTTVITNEDCEFKELENDEYYTKDTELKTNKTGSEQVNSEEYIKRVKMTQETEGSTTPTSSAVEFILENENVVDNTLLKITESNDDLTKSSVSSVAQEIETKAEESSSVLERQCEPVNESSKTFSRFEVRSIPLKLDSPNSKMRDIGVKREPPTPPQRRRSVKEIIESINKCQKLLKVNQDLKIEKAEKDKVSIDLLQASSSSSSKSFNSKTSFAFDRNMNDTAEKPYQNKRMFSDVSELNNNVRTEDLTNIPLFVEKFNELNNNNPNSIFEKYVPRDNKPDEKISNVEWNPVPKPRRYRHSTQGSSIN